VPPHWGGPAALIVQSALVRVGLQRGQTAFEIDLEIIGMERSRGRRAVATIGELAAVGVQITAGRVQHGGTGKNRRIDETRRGVAVAARRDQPDFGFLPVRLSRNRPSEGGRGEDY
jgi:hypothetical protein